jgi:hypothetical protein
MTPDDIAESTKPPRASAGGPLRDIAAALQRSDGGCVRNRRSVGKSRRSIGMVLTQRKALAPRRAETFRNLHLLATTAQLKLSASAKTASVLAQLGIPAPDCDPSVASATLSQRVGLVITAAGSNGRTT